MTALIILTFGLILTGCGTLSDDGNQNELTLQFQTSTSTSTNSSAQFSAANSQMAGDTLRIEGNNGTLVIHDIRFIVEEFEAERQDGDCGEFPDDSEADEDCEEFESGPFFIDLPLDGSPINVVSEPIEPGLYEELEFEVDDLELDEEDEDEQNAKQQLIDQVRSEFPDWPDSVSMVILGDFVDTQGDTTSFKVFAEAEIEIELEFNPLLEIADNSIINKLVTVRINPQAWLLNPDGDVIDLREFDFESTGRIFEFEAEFENGFESLEVEDEDDDNDDDSDDD